MSDIVLKSDLLEVCEIKKKTTMRLFRNLVVGDKISIETPIEYTFSSRGNHVVGLHVTNIRTGDVEVISMNEMAKMARMHFVFKTAK